MLRTFIRRLSICRFLWSGPLDANMNKIFLYKLRVRKNVSISLFIQYFSPLKCFSLDSSALILYLWILLDFTDRDHFHIAAESISFRITSVTCYLYVKLKNTFISDQ